MAGRDGPERSCLAMDGGIEVTETGIWRSKNLAMEH